MGILNLLGLSSRSPQDSFYSKCAYQGRQQKVLSSLLQRATGKLDSPTANCSQGIQELMPFIYKRTCKGNNIP